MIAAGVFVMREDDLDLEDAVETAVVLALGVWLVTQAIGLVARRLEAGHAMRIDAAGLHHPGWDVVPWAAIRRAWLQPSKKILGYRREDLMLDIDPACQAPSAGTYVRWMFGPIEGLWRRDKPVRVPLVGLDIEPVALLASIEAMRNASSTSALIDAFNRPRP